MDIIMLKTLLMAMAHDGSTNQFKVLIYYSLIFFES